MCGIVGFTNPAQDGQLIIERMLRPIAYRGPDQRALFVDERIAVGHLRLTIVAPDGGQQPRVDRESGDVLAYNGEIYDYQEHANWLRQQGVVLRDHSDTEVLFQMIRYVGLDAALDRLDGMFAFFFRDGASGANYLVRDRFGEKPLFYAVVNGVLIFASEVKALLAHPAAANFTFDHQAISQYLMFDYVPSPRTGLLGIEKLRPGEIITFQGGKLQQGTFWKPTLPSNGGAKAPQMSIDGYADKLCGLLDQSIKSRLVADVPVGLFLSGGLDSALIAARAREFAPDITAYTIRFGGDGYDETSHAATVASAFELRHEIYDVGEADLFTAIAEIEANMDEPFADNSIVPTYLLCKAARRDVTVALGGDGGDELFAGYMNFQALLACPMLSAMPKSLNRIPRALASILPVIDEYMGLGFKVDQILNGWGEKARYQPLQWMSAFNHRDLQGVLSKPTERDPLIDIIDMELLQSHPSNAVERLQYLFCRLYLSNDILTKVDRASMYNGLEVRAPFLARPLAEFALSLPNPIKISGLQTKRLLRHLGRRLLPKSITERTKHGFALPVAGLIRGPLSEPINDTLRDRSNPMMDYFSAAGITRLLEENNARRRDHRKRIWSLYCLFLFARNIQTARTADFN